VRIATKQPFNVMKTQPDIRKNLEDTLTKLRTDHIDVYLIHNIQASTWEDIKKREILDEYEKFKQEGLIGSIAFSYHGELDTFQDILSYYPWAMCQVQQNLLDLDKEVTTQAFELAGQKGCALVIMEPLRGGGLASAPQDVQAIYDASETKRSPAEWAFRYVYNFPQVSSILSGMTTLEQLKQNIETFSKPEAVSNSLTETEKDMLMRVKAAYESRVTIPCTGCEYCLPCPQNVDIPGVFERYNTGAMFGNYDNMQRTYMFLRNAGGDVSHCVQCGLCETKCPQHIEIIKQLQTAHATLDGWYE
jgi:predicted aldo/keto reductase-like oxidoreductase